MDGDWIPVLGHHPWRAEHDEKDEVRDSEEAKERDIWARWDAVRMDCVDCEK